MTIRRRLAVAFVAILFFFGCTLGVYLWSARLRTRTVGRLDRALTRQAIIASIRQELDNLHKQVILLSELEIGNEPLAIDLEARRSFDKKLNLVLQQIRRLKVLSSPEDQTNIGEMERTYQNLAWSWQGFYDYLGEEPTWAIAHLARADPLSRRLLNEVVPALQQNEMKGVQKAEADFQNVEQLTKRVSISIFVVSVLFAAVIAYRVSRYIGQGFSELSHGADMIGSMDLSHRIHFHRRDELAQLASAFNGMAERLQIAQTQLTGANRELELRNEEILLRQHEELALSAIIQQGLMALKIPELPFAQIKGKNISCREIGGDFFDVVSTGEDDLGVVIADVSGKGISAAIMASMLQGMIHSDLVENISLYEIVTSANRFFCQRELAAKYATLVILRLDRFGNLEYVNCGHIAPLLIRGPELLRLSVSNPPIGLLPNLNYEIAHDKVRRGDRLLVVTDGLTEAANSKGEFFGETRLRDCVISSSHIEDLFSAVRAHCGDTPLNDDCTIIELIYNAQDYEFFLPKVVNLPRAA